MKSQPDAIVNVERLIRQVAADNGRPLDTWKRYTFNTLRLFLLTAGNVLGFDDNVAHAVGSWHDVPQGEGTSSRSIKLMSLYSSDERAVSSGAAKQQVLDIFLFLSLQHPSDRSILSGTPKKVPWGTLSMEGACVCHKEAKDKKPKRGKERKDTKSEDVKHDKAKKSKAVHGKRDCLVGSGSVDTP